MMKKTLPPKLYKYQPYTTYTLDNLKDRRLWFSKPAKFNDPFDCAIHFEIASHTAKDWKAIYKKYQKEAPDKNACDEKYLTKGKINQLFKEGVAKGLRQSLDQEINIMRNKNGIACFSEVFDNILMWAHYADGHRGFCLEFDTKYTCFSKAFPVIYSDLLPRVNLADTLVRKTNQNLMDVFTTKSELWSYEKEWRLFHEEGDKKYGVEVESLSGVYFGCEMPFVHKEVIALILAGSSTKLYEMQKVKGEFKVDF